MNKITVISTTVAVAVLSGLIGFAPIAAADTDPQVGDPTSTASLHQEAPISAETGAPLGDEGLGTDPLIPLGTDPQSPVRLGYIDRNHDEGNTSNGMVDTAF